MSMQEGKFPPPTHTVSTFDRTLTIVSDEAVVNFNFVLRTARSIRNIGSRLSHSLAAQMNRPARAGLVNREGQMLLSTLAG